MANQLYKNILKSSSHLLLLVGLLLFSTVLRAQDPATTAPDTIYLDSLKGPELRKEPKHSPKLASILSAVVPGAGQIYNKQYFWAPVFWGAIGVSFYYARTNLKEFKEFKQGYILATDTISGNELPRFAGKSTAFILAGVDFYRRNRDFSYAFVAISYILNIVQASVGAHMFYYDINENTTLNIQPYQNFSAQPAYGLSLVMNF